MSAVAQGASNMVLAFDAAFQLIAENSDDMSIKVQAGLMAASAVLTAMSQISQAASDQRIRAIDKEIDLIQNRDYQNLESIKQEINSLQDLEINYADYNVYLIKEKSLKNTKLILIISTILGLIIGVFFVLISNAFQSKKTH